jgi:Damage-control phosphatase ARMT1-like domain
MHQEQARQERPPELLNNDPNGFAWGVWHDRTPKLVAQIRDAHPYGPEQSRALDALLEEIASGPIQPLPFDAHDQATWVEWGTDCFGKLWLDAPFLWSESYFYRRVLEATGFFRPGPWRGVDPFQPMKAAELRDRGLESELATLNELTRLPLDEQAHAKLLAALWGNQADLGFQMSITAAVGPADSAGLVADDSSVLWSNLDSSANVVLVLDNAGRELLADFVFADHLLQHRQARSITLHVKPQPYYVSDATTTDVVDCLLRLAASPGSPSEIAHRLRDAASTGRLRVYTHDFYCAPWTYHRMPDDLRATLEEASLTILKGDLNYRRLVGDVDWSPSTPFANAAGYFPTPVVTLRILKSDVVTGIEPNRLATLDATGQPWRTSGRYALVQANR